MLFWVKSPYRSFFSLRTVLLLAVFIAVLPILAEPPRVDNEVGVDVIQRYQQALRQQQETVKNVRMDVTMEASIPKLKKFGRLNALRHISRLGRITYKVLGFSGDDTERRPAFDGGPQQHGV